MSKQKLVSVIIPTYERADTLSRAINSVLNQTYKDIEIVVVDDNDPSSEYRKQTEELMNNYSEHKNIIYLKHEKNKNGSAARNTGFRNSNGEFIMFLDDDDEFFPKKVSSQVDRMNSLDKSWGACYSSYIRKKNGKTVMYGAEKREGDLLKEELMRNLFIHAGSNLMIRREVVTELNGFDESFLRNQDVEFVSRILMKYKLAYVDIRGLIVHVHERIPGKRSFEEITLDYMNKFSSQISELPEHDRRTINKMINLQLFRNFIFTKGERKKAFKYIVRRELTLGLVSRYMLHLLKRKLSKKAYGFKI
ncbi:glycosyltransferase family 2 protein [Alkalihalophilus sp. As8PL]|uniref:Glycosyltransferase family 2 protein n=1 Tax=Alkalihalophilus sp. As8PL TaxID=3237103 RepID=A0AB39BQE2_9BACI